MPTELELHEDYEVLEAAALGGRLGFIPRPNRQLAMGPIWYEKSVKEWEAKEEEQAHGE